MTDPAQALKALKPKHTFFVGIDSDGCAFDTMEIKHKECFIPKIIKHWGLQAVSKYAREAAEFVNLYSRWRGINRWPALLRTFDLLNDRPEVQARQCSVPTVPSLRAFVSSAVALSNASLKDQVDRSGDEVLRQALTWSEAVNATIADMVEGVPPFPYMRESLEKMQDHVDAIVVSQTPCEALGREWAEHKIDPFVQIIAGQEMGTKSDHIRLATEERYEKTHILMIGDAPGDHKAATDNGALFYPINPGHEEASWERFYTESLDTFLKGQYAGDYERSLIDEFNTYLPDTPPWKNGQVCCCR